MEFQLMPPGPGTDKTEQIEALKRILAHTGPALQHWRLQLMVHLVSGRAAAQRQGGGRRAEAKKKFTVPFFLRV